MYMKRNEDGTYQPGIIYELRCKIEDAWHPFYVGETISISQRIGQHRVSAKYADEESTLVYRFIHDYLDANNIEWDLFEVGQYDEQGPEALEDEHIMKLLVEGVSLKNSKKGNANWMTERMAVADDMRKREITSYSLYKQVLTYEEQQRRVDEANAIRVAEELEQQRVLTKQEQIRQQHIEQMKELAELARIKLEKDNAARLAKEELKRVAWLADAPARELRLKIEAERLQAEDLVREQRLAKVDANIAQHEERQKIVREQQHELLLSAQARMAKILERIQK
jgi:hypothetical protein